MYSKDFTATIVVAGNTGSGTITIQPITGMALKIIMIDAPAAATYDWVMRDADNYAITGEVGASGDETYHLDAPVRTSVTITLTDATNGSYAIKIGGYYNG